MTKIGVAAILSPAFFPNVQAIPAIQVEQRRSSSLTRELEALEKSLALSYFWPQAPSESLCAVSAAREDEDKFLLPAPKSTLVSVVVSREKPPFVFHADELEAEDEILMPLAHSTPVTVEIGFSGRPPFIFRDEFEDEGL